MLALPSRRIVATAIVIGLAAGLLFWPRDASLPTSVQDFAEQYGLRGGVIAFRALGASEATTWTFGQADSTGRKMAVNDRFKLASLSKPLTAAAVLALARRGEIDLDAPIAEILPGTTDATDPRMQRVTPRHLLQHSGGFDATQNFDPFFLTEKELRRRASGGSTSDSIEGCAGVVQAMQSIPLQFEPGSAYSYSNLGYCYLELLIAAKTRTSYESAIKDIIPNLGEFSLDVTQTTTELILDRVDQNLLVNDPRIVSGAGGWIADAGSYLDFASRPIDPLTFSRPAYSDSIDYYGLGWRVWELPSGVVLTHFGAMPDVFTVVMRGVEGPVLVALFSGRPPDPHAAFMDFLEAVLASDAWQEADAAAPRSSKRHR